ncbi:MAG TPA: hypothetical protein VND45_00155 [Thermoanaerobaculia bacterium]|nr:hypothetical protein [Thermoanaerobaculia bacterium]
MAAKRTFVWLGVALLLLLIVGGAAAALLLRPGRNQQPTDYKAAVPRNGIAMWLVADDAAPAAVNGRVEAWQNPEFPTIAAKATGESRPTVVRKAAADHAALRFDGVDDMLTAPIDISPASMPEVTIFTVFTPRTSERTPFRKLYGDDDGGFDRAVGFDSRMPETFNNYGVFTGSGVASCARLNAGVLYIAADQFTANSFSSWIDGAPGARNVPATWKNDALPNLYIGGTGTRFREPWYGDIAEMIVYRRTLTEEERRKVEMYLVQRYNSRFALGR